MIKKIILFCLLLCSCTYYHDIKNSLFFQQENRKKSWVYFYQGLEQKRLGLWKEAAESFHISVALNYENARVHAHLAECFVSLNLQEKAIVSLQEAEKYASKDDYMIFFDMGKIYESMGNNTKAQELYNKSFSLCPKLQSQKKLSSPDES